MGKQFRKRGPKRKGKKSHGGGGNTAENFQHKHICPYCVEEINEEDYDSGVCPFCGAMITTE